MNNVEFCKSLSDRITPEEWRALECAENELLINDHNRLALLEMREVGRGLIGMGSTLRTAPGGAGGTDAGIDAFGVAALEDALQAFLDEHMAEAPEGHKWIVIASLYLTYVAKRPMHPIERAGVVVEERDGQTTYLCPSKVPGDNPICDACVCVPAPSIG